MSDISHLKGLIDTAAELEDQSVEQQNNFNDDPPPAGITVGRFVEYIELGMHEQPDYMGKEKPDAEMVRVTFELLHPDKNMREWEHDGEKHRHGQLLSIQLPKKMNEKAKYKRLFNKMTYGRDIKHLAQMLGEAFIIEVFHNTVKKEGRGDVTYANLDKDGNFGISAPYVVDPMTQERKEYNISEPTYPIRLFLWKNPTQETWDSLFIDGTREVKQEDGSLKQVSKNWLQERIQSATNFSGSPLDQMLNAVDDLAVTETKAETADLPDTLPSEGQPTEAAEKPAETQVDAPATDAAEPSGSTADDALAALGLVA
ncbi:hypothetical protein HW532_20920 [Kaustia mangrovi]|uniref:Uncharacterized protein n=1 Tax=Kaustia mangrovi TaxID=2593653 RepID=A0A7S8C7N6_9HYPH|nr:hypothetical protein [Kaustia mangrovi]QPC44943.1 hypothetical protein HW532_20920 [Kaustia mangrovi]